MSEQRHIIKRQILELKVQNSEEAQRLQAELSRVYRQRIVPLIDRYCTELSEPDRIHRIESLEVDVGYVDPDRLSSSGAPGPTSCTLPPLKERPIGPTGHFTEPC